MKALGRYSWIHNMEFGRCQIPSGMTVDCANCQTAIQLICIRLHVFLRKETYLDRVTWHACMAHACVYLHHKHLQQLVYLNLSSAYVHWWMVFQSVFLILNLILNLCLTFVVDLASYWSMPGFLLSAYDCYLLPILAWTFNQVFAYQRGTLLPASCQPLVPDFSCAYNLVLLCLSAIDPDLQPVSAHIWTWCILSAVLLHIWYQCSWVTVTSSGTQALVSFHRPYRPCPNF